VEFVFDPAPVTPFGGLTLAARLIDRLKLRRSINDRVKVFENKRGYDEGTHVLTHAYNLFLGGSCIEDIDKMQADEGVQRIIGADQIPDPTTAEEYNCRDGGCGDEPAEVREGDEAAREAQRERSPDPTRGRPQQPTRESWAQVSEEQAQGDEREETLEPPGHPGRDPEHVVAEKAEHPPHRKAVPATLAEEVEEGGPVDVARAEL